MSTEAKPSEEVFEFPPVPERLVIPAEGLELKRLLVDDAIPMFETIDEDREHLRQYDEDVADKYKTVDDIVRSFNNPGNRLRLGIWDGARFTGSINLEPDEDNTKAAEVGYWIGGKYIKQGRASRALRAMTKYGFDEGYELLFATVHPENVASQKTLEKIGYVFARKIIDNNGKEKLIYELRKSDAQAEHAA